MNPPVWLVTGASSGVGRVLAVALAASGAEVLLAARSASGLKDTAAWCGPRAQPLPVDLSDPASVTALSAQVTSHLAGRPLAGIIHAAGLMAWDSEATASGWSRVALVNAVSPWNLTLALEGPLQGAQDSRVLFVAGAPFTFMGLRPDLSGWKGVQNSRGMALALEAASAKVMMARVLHRRWLGRISVFAFHPGFVKSNLVDGLGFPLSVLGCLAQPFLATRCKTGEFLALDPSASALSGQMIAASRAVPDCPFPSAVEFEDEWVSRLCR